MDPDLDTAVALCEEAIADMADRERSTMEHTLVTLGFVAEASNLPPVRRQQWTKDGPERRDPSFQSTVTKMIRDARREEYGSRTMEGADPDVRPLVFSHIRRRIVGSELSLLLFCVTTRRSPSGFTPLKLRELADFSCVELESRFRRRPDDTSVARLVRAGGVDSALAAVVAASRSVAGILWTYDPDRRQFSSLSASGFTAKDYRVDSYHGGGSASAAGVVGMVRPEEECVVFELDNPSVWRPRAQAEWKPHDMALFKRERWRSCVAVPVISRGALVGAMSLYSRGPAQDLVEGVTQARFLTEQFADHLAALHLERRMSTLSRLFEEEISRTTLGVLSLGYIHDIVGRHDQISKAVEQADLEAHAVVDRLGVSASPLLSELEVVKGHLRRQEQIIREMRRMAREGQTVADEGWCNLNAVIDGLRAFLDMIVRRESHGSVRKCQVEVPNEALEVPLPAVKLERIVVNLVTNAAQWSRSKVRLRIRSEDESTAVLEVSDDGAGIGEGEIDRVFDLFYTSRPGGSGLGLYLVRRFVSEAGGAVNLQSRPYVGTDVIVRLPVGRSAPRGDRR